MPRPVFGAADWWTFVELGNTKRFDVDRNRDGFPTVQQRDADGLAAVAFPEREDQFTEEPWPDLEFCVSRRSKRVLMVRQREGGGA